MANKQNSNTPWYERWYDWAVSGKDTPAVPYKNPVTGAPVTNVAPIDPKTGRRAGAYPSTGWFYEPLANFKNNIGPEKWLEAARAFGRSIVSMPTALPEQIAAMSSIYRGWAGHEMSDAEYYRTFIDPRMQASGQLGIQAGVQTQIPMRRSELRKIREQDERNATAFANSFSYRDKGGLHFDFNGMIRNFTQDPAGAGVAALQAIRSGGASLAEKLAAREKAAIEGSRSRTVYKGLRAASEATSKGAGALSYAANPIVPLTGMALASAPARAVVTKAINLAKGIKSIYRPDFLKEWEPFKRQKEGVLRTNGVSEDQIKSPQVQQSIYDSFNRATNNRFANPLTDKASAAMAKAGLMPSQYYAPHVGDKINRAIGAKGGINEAILKEGAIKAGGAKNVTRSSATGEAPGLLFKNQEGPARQRTEGQMSEALSARFAPPPGAQAVTVQDIADDFINSNIERRNLSNRSYRSAEAYDGVYQDPNAFIGALDQQIESNLRSRGIDPSELSTNSDNFKSANAAGASLRRNIANHGFNVPPVQSLGYDGRMYTFIRSRDPAKAKDINEGNWIDPDGNGVNNTTRNILNSDPVAQRQIANPPPAPVNKLSLQNLEIERRNLNEMAAEAYDRAVEGNGDFREYNAIAAMRDAIDDTSIQMAPAFSGDAKAAVPLLKQARSQFRDWRANGIESPNPIVKDMAARTQQRTSFDPNTNSHSFSNTPGSRAVVANALEGKIVGTKDVAPEAFYGSGPSATNPAEVYTALSGSLSPAGRQSLAGYVRTQGYGRPDATRESLANLDASFAGQGIDLLTPEERNFFDINLSGRKAVSPSAIPSPDPFNLNPFDTGEGQSTFSNVARPLGKSAMGYLMGSAAYGPVTGAALAAAGLTEDIAQRGWRRISPFRREQYGAPDYRMNLPNVTLPLAAGTAVASTQANQRAKEVYDADLEAARRYFAPPQQPSPQAPQIPQAPQQQQAPAQTEQDADLEEYMRHLKDAQSQPPPQPQPQPEGQYRGGRAAYKSGGKVGSDIDPLVRALINKAKRAKKVSDRVTEPLLNAKDDAIVSALSVAQKAI